MGALRTSEDSEVVGGEARQAKSDDNRVVDAPGQIIIDSAPVVAAAPARAVPRPLPQPVPAGQRRAGGLWFVVLLYLIGAAALGAAVYERFVA